MKVRLKVRGALALFTGSMIGIAVLSGIPASAAANYTTSDSSLQTPQTQIYSGASGPATNIRFYVNAHPDDETGADAMVFNNTGNSPPSGVLFPVEVYLTNGENTYNCPHPSTDYGSILPLPGTNPTDNSTWAGQAEGDDPTTFPHLPDVNPTTGWSPLLSDAAAGRCRANRLASMSDFWTQSVHMQTSDPTPNPSQQPPDGQVCFTTPPPVPYVHVDSTTAIPDQTSSKDPCAYVWRSANGDIVAFNLGDNDQGWFACPSASTGGKGPDAADYVTAGPSELNGSPQCPSTGTTPDGSTDYLPAGDEGYSLSPADVTWALSQLDGAIGTLLPNLPVHDNVASAFSNTGGGAADSGYQSKARPSYNYSNGTDGYYGSSNGETCVAYPNYNHYAVQRSLYHDGTPSVNWNWGRICAGDPSYASATSMPSVQNVDALSESSTAYYETNYGWLGEPFVGSDGFSNQTCTLGTQPEDMWGCVNSFWHLQVSSYVPASWSSPGM